MENIKRAIKYQFIESKKFILEFWITVILVDIFFYILNKLSSVNTTIGLSIESSETSTPVSVAGVNLMIIFIASIVYNYERNYESFPLSQSLSMTRKDYFKSFLIDNVVISFIFAIIQGVLLKIDPKIMELVGKEPVYEFINFNLKTDNILFIIFSLFILFLACISFFNLLASLNYKFGYKLWIVIVGFNIILSVFNIKILGNISDKIFKYIEKYLATRFGVFEVIVILVSVAVLYTLNYFITINSNVKKRTI